jgi:hypothetical protein
MSNSPRREANPGLTQRVEYPANRRTIARAAKALDMMHCEQQPEAA